MLKSNLINNTTVLAARDGVVSIAKTVGLDLGKYLKFKPWGAMNFAKGANGALAVIGVALEVWDSWEKYKREDEFKKMVQSIVSNFEKQRQDFIELVKGEDFYRNFFPDYIDLQHKIKDLDLSLSESRERQQHFEHWKESARAVEAKFRML